MARLYANENFPSSWALVFGGANSTEGLALGCYRHSDNTS